MIRFIAHPFFDTQKGLLSDEISKIVGFWEIFKDIYFKILNNKKYSALLSLLYIFQVSKIVFVLLSVICPFHIQTSLLKNFYSPQFNSNLPHKPRIRVGFYCFPDDWMNPRIVIKIYLSWIQIWYQIIQLFL